MFVKDIILNKMPKYTNAMFEADLAELENLINKYEGASQSGGAEKKWDRSFTVVELNGKQIAPQGRYRVNSKTGGGPADAAQRAAKQLLRKANNKKAKITFKLKETTSKSKHGTFGPYEAHMKKLSKPKILPIAGKKIKIENEYIVKKVGDQKGGWVFYN